MTDNRERQVLRAEDMQRASTAMMKFGVEAVKKNPVKVYSCSVYINHWECRVQGTYTFF